MAQNALYIPGPVKQKLTNKSLAGKCKPLKNLENGMANKDVAAKDGVPRNTALTWVKSKHKLTVLLDKRERTSREKIDVVGTMKK